MYKIILSITLLLAGLVLPTCEKVQQNLSTNSEPEKFNAKILTRLGVAMLPWPFRWR